MGHRKAYPGCLLGVPAQGACSGPIRIAFPDPLPKGLARDACREAFPILDGQRARPGFALAMNFIPFSISIASSKDHQFASRIHKAMSTAFPKHREH
ncbi:hypothetical protein Dimus_001356, partial [Dionaea muscipula]